MPGPMANHVPSSSPEKAVITSALPEKLSTDSILPNGAAFEPPSLPRQNESSMRSSLQDLPPELRHWTQDYQPLGKLFGRAAQEAYNGLRELVSDLAKLPETPHVNGSQPHTDLVASAAGAQRRLKWLNFAHDQRNRFIKLLIISQWSGRIREIERLVDVNLWLNEQFARLQNTEFQLGELRRNMSNARFPSPDIDTALDVLNNGTSSRMSHLQYIPPRPLSATKVLDVLQNLDLLLHIRLNLHESVPARLDDYIIHSGRVTFRVPNEFEVDLSIADEDPASQLWFVDFRLAFSATETLASQLRGPLEQHVNNVLATEGLAGCYDFLHEFVLTHKINILRRQASELSRGAWASSLRIEHVHRNLVIQYWSNRPGRKSWVQVGVQREKRVDEDLSAPEPTSRLLVKCFQHGREVPANAFKAPENELDVESILEYATKKHVSALLSSLEADYLRSASHAGLPLSSYSDDVYLDTVALVLHLPLVAPREATVAIEQVTGNYVMGPSTAVGERFVETLNSVKDTVGEVFPILERWRTAQIQAQCEMFACNSGFQNVDPPGLAFEDVKKEIGQDIARAKFFNKQAWSRSNWYLCVGVHPFSQTWWAAKVITIGQKTEIVAKETIPNLAEFFWRPEYPQISLSDVDRLLLAIVSLHILSTHLHGMQTDVSTAIRMSQSPGDVAVVKFDARALLDSKGLLNDSTSQATTSLASDYITLFVGDIDGSTEGEHTPLVNYTVTGFLDTSKVKPGLLSQLQSSDLRVDSAGRFALKVKAPLGSTDIVYQLSTRLHSLQRLTLFLMVLGKHRLPCQMVTEKHATFQYQDEPQLTATITFASKDSDRLSLDLAPITTNPQQRIIGFLTQTLNRTLSGDLNRAFHAFLLFLTLSLPVLRAFDRLEAADPAALRVRIHPRHEASYLLSYPRLKRRFRVNMTMRKNQPYWLISQAKGRQNGEEDANEQIEKRIGELFLGSGKNWHGRRDGAVAESTGIEAALDELDRAVSECEKLAKSARAVKSAQGKQKPKELNGQVSRQTAQNAQPQQQQQQQQQQQTQQPNGQIAPRQNNAANAKKQQQDKSLAQRPGANNVVVLD